jgi:rhamnogalacturonan endolyase
MHAYMQGYQFWTRATSDGSFSIGNVREGTYNLYAWVPGILGDYMHVSPVTIAASATAAVVNLGDDLVFEPPRSGPTLWEIGVPDRTAAEFYVPDADPKYASRLFLTKDRYRQYGLWERYAALYPAGDLVFTVGKSNHSRDWFFAHVTRRVVGGGGVVGNNNNNIETTTTTTTTSIVPTTWQIRFHLDRVVADGTYTLRIALAASHMSNLKVQVNSGAGAGAGGEVNLLGDNNAIARHGIRGTQWSLDMDVKGHLLNQGDNTIYINQTTPYQFAGVMYDYIRLEGPSTSTYS